MKEYDLYVPVFFNGGKRLPAGGLNRLKRRLVQKFGGLTHFPQKNKGVSRIGKATFVDAIMIIRILSEKDESDFWRKLKADLQREWKQNEILIVARNVTTL